MTNHMAIYLVPEMQRVYKSHNPRYMVSDRKDFRPLLEIANFLADQMGLSNPENHMQQILDAWSQIAASIMEMPFWRQKSLASIANHIQEIALIVRDGDTSKGAAKFTAANLSQKLNERFK